MNKLNNKSVFVSQDIPYTCAQDGTTDRSNDKYPKICESLTTFKQSRTNGAGRIDRSTSVVDAYKMN